MPSHIQAVVITASDACSVGERTDESGAALVTLLSELGAEIDVLRVIAGSVGVGDVGGHELLPNAQQTHVPFEISGHSFKHDACPKAVSVPRCKPLIPGGRI